MLQIHPLRRCNLRCRHCYSSSGPSESDILPVALLESAIGDAAALGWQYASISGGEPLLYPDLGRLLGQARDLGLRTAITTNGTLLRRVAPLADRLDFVALSLDGLGARHDAMRGWPGAFEALVRGLPWLRGAGIPFGFLFTLTRDNLHELPDVVAFATEHGASVVQIHPLAPAGRGALLGLTPDDEDAARAWLEVWRLRQSGEVRIRLPLDFADLERMRAPGTSLPEVLSPLVIEADGTVVPLQHGFPREWALGSLHDAGLAELIRRWTRLEAFRALCAITLQRRAEAADLPFLDVYQALAEAAAQGSASAA